MEYKRLKSISLVLAIWLSFSSCVMCQAPTQRPIAQTTTRPGNIAVTTARPGNVAGGVGNNAGANVVVEIQTPPTTPANLISVINAKPAENRPIAPGPTTRNPNVGVTVSVGTTPKPTPSKLPGCPVVNLMATKTGFFSEANDPCSYVSCIRADSFLHCATVKCDPGQGFSAATGRCIQSNQCVAIKPK